jgi:hypothetical protein
MPIQKLLATGDFTPEERHVFELAFQSTLRKLSLVDRNDPVCEMIAKKVIEVGLTGACNTVAITELAL